MKFHFLLSFLFSMGIHAQTIEELPATIKKFDQALIQKDTVSLDIFLHENASITHSNGFTEDKLTMKKNTASTFIQYQKIQQNPNLELVQIEDNSFLVYRIIEVKGIYDIYDFNVKLRLMEVWTWLQNRWQLLGRQSLEIKNDE